MRYIGGEVALQSGSAPQTFLGYSGRAGIRMFCRNFPDKKILIPDFLCYIIVDLLNEEKAEFDFYHVKPNLEIDLDSIVSKEFDVLFIINYYGKRHTNISRLDLENFILLQDSVFDLDVVNYLDAPRWYGFNSLRKMTELADGCIIKTNLEVKNLIECCEGKFAEEKYRAKAIKYDFLHHHRGTESKYLELFQKAEKMLDNQKRLCRISDRSLGLLFELFRNYPKERERRKENYEILQSALEDVWIGVESDFYSFFVIKVSQRDELRRYLFGHNIFLPVHWPWFGVDNPLYHEVLSIPVFSRYSSDDIRFIADCIREFLDNWSHK